MNYEQSSMIDTLYKRFKTLDCLKDFLYYETERKLYNADLTYKSEEFINDFIVEMNNNIVILSKNIKVALNTP